MSFAHSALLELSELSMSVKQALHTLSMLAKQALHALSMSAKQALHTAVTKEGFTGLHASAYNISAHYLVRCWDT